MVPGDRRPSAPISSYVVPDLTAADEHTALRFPEFFAAIIRNQHTRRAHLKHGRTFQKAAPMVDHTHTRTTRLYYRRHDDMTPGEVERIRV